MDEYNGIIIIILALYVNFVFFVCNPKSGLINNHRFGRIWHHRFRKTHQVNQLFKNNVLVNDIPHSIRDPVVFMCCMINLAETSV